MKNFHCILLNYTSTSKHLYLLHLSFIYITYAVSKCLKYYSFISFICSLSSIIISFSSNCYSSSNKYLCITIITQIWPYHWTLKFNSLLYTPNDSFFFVLELYIFFYLFLYHVQYFLLIFFVVKYLRLLSAILFPIKSPVASAVFWIILLEAVLSASVANFLAWTRIFWVYLPWSFYLCFTNIFTHISSKRQKSITF